MKYLSKSTVFESWKNIVKQGEVSRASLNKFFGMLDILKNLSLGFSIERLSIDLKISTNTLNTHLRNIRKKMNVSTTAKAIDVFKNIHIDK